MCRDVCYVALDRAVQMGGIGEVVEIDECLLRGKRKSNKGRLTAGDLQQRNEQRRKRPREGILV